MEIADAQAVLEDYRHQPLAAIGEAISVLKEKYGTYKEIAKQVSPSAHTIGLYYRLSQLPDGIRWKIEQRELAVSLAQQICRLEDTNDQWLLAFAIVDAQEKNEGLTEQDCTELVDDIRQSGKSLEEALSQRFGFNFDESVPLILSFDYWFRFKLCRSAWNRQQNWADLVYDIINEWLEGREFASTADLHKISQELIAIGKRVEELGE